MRIHTVMTVMLMFSIIIQPGLCKEEEMRIVNVADFGAVADDGNDDTLAVLAALESCREGGPVTLLFPKGRYDFFAGSNPANPNVLFPLQGFHDLTIDGDGSEFIIHGVTGVFDLRNCERVTLKSLTVDSHRPPFSVGTVIDAKDNHFDVKVFAEYPVTGGEPVGAFMDYDPLTRLPRKRGLDEYYTVTSTELIEPQVLRIHLRHEARIKPGVWAVLRHQVYDRDVFQAHRCTDLKVHGVTVHSAPGMAFRANNCTNLEFLRFKVIPRPVEGDRTNPHDRLGSNPSRSGSGHLISATADAMHLSGNRGTITIRDCEFDGMGDDAANIKTGLFLAVKSKVDERTILAQHNLKIPDPPDAGDIMNIVGKDDLISYGSATVSSVELLQDGMHRIVFVDDLPDELAEGDLFGNVSRTAKVRISNSIVHNNRARGFLIQNPDTIVENCTFRNITSGGVWVLIEAFFFYESINAWDVTIRNNRFENCNYGGPIGEGVLGVLAWTGLNTFSDKPGIFRNIVIEGNIVDQADNSGIFVTGGDGVMIRNNTLRNVCDRPTRQETSAAIYVMGSRNVLIEGNSIDPEDQGEGFETAIRLGPGNETETIEIRD